MIKKGATMFFHLFKYKLLTLLRSKELIFWNAFFPILLGSMFFITFKNADSYEFAPVKVAIVKNTENAQFEAVLNEVSKEGENQLLDVTKTDLDNAKTLLTNDDVKGIIYIDETPSITISQNGIDQSIIQSFMEEYNSHSLVIMQIANEHPQKLSSAIDKLHSDVLYNKEVMLNNNETDHFVVYFYSLIAMTCLYSSMTGVYCTIGMLANQSPAGMRREASSQHKLTAILSDYFATVLIQFSCVLLLLFYLNVILKIDFGKNIFLVILTSFIGCLIGTSIGILIGSATKFSENVKVGICVAFSMICAFCSGLMFKIMKQIIEANAPVFNRINPAALITDSLYSLNMYNDYSRFTVNMLILVAMAVLCCTLSYFSLRRTKYANL